MNPFAVVKCVNMVAEDYEEIPICRWRFWVMRLFCGELARCWREI